MASGLTQLELWSQLDEQVVDLEDVTLHQPWGPHGYISFTQVSQYASCPEKYRLSYIEKSPRTASGAAIAGSSVHAAIQHSEKNEWWQANDLDAARGAFLEEFERRVQEAGGESAVRWSGRKSKEWPDGETYAWWVMNVQVMLKRYFAIRKADQEMGTEVLPGGVEQEVVAVLRIPRTKRSLLVKGHIDATMMIASGEPVLRDWKTGSWSEPQQLAVYAWLLANRVDPLNVDVGQVVSLRAQDRKKWVVGYNLRPWVPLVPRLILDTVSGIEKKVFPLRPSSFCASCSVRKSCVWGKTLEPVPSD